MISSKVNLVRYWPWRRTWPCNSFWFKDSFEIRTGICSDSSMVHFKDWGRSNDGKPISFCQNSYKIFDFAISIITFINCNDFSLEWLNSQWKTRKWCNSWNKLGSSFFWFDMSWCESTSSWKAAIWLSCFSYIRKLFHITLWVSRFKGKLHSKISSYFRLKW